MSADPRNLIAANVRAFEAATKGLFRVTRGHLYHTTEDGIYATIYVRAAEHVEMLLSVDRELLVLFSAHEEAPQSSVNHLIELVDAAKGRVEQSVTIVAHHDPTGSRKFANWGRQMGLTILPLQITDDMPEADDLEGVLLQEFYSHDPFDVTGPVFRDNDFYGRRSEAQELARQLRSGQVRCRLGVRRVGKTSLLNRVLYELQYANEATTVMIDCSKDSIWSMDSGRILEAIARAITQATRSDETYVAVEWIPQPISSREGYEALVGAVRDANRTIILVFDEIDYITPASTSGHHWKTEFNAFWRNLRAAYQEASRHDAKMSLLVTGVSSKWFSVSRISGDENAALSFLPEQYLQPLDDIAAVEMLQAIGRSVGLYFDQENASPILIATSRIPFWMRKAGSYIHRQIDIKPRPLRPAMLQIQELVDDFVRSEGAQIAGAALVHLFGIYPELEAVARSCSAGQPPPQSHATTALMRYLVIDQNAVITGDMMREGVRVALEPRPDDRVVEGVSSMTTLSISNLDDWAHELSELGRRRNILETELRGLAISAIRLDSAGDGKGNLKDRLLRIIDEKRRSQLTSLSPKEIVSKYFWLDLVKLYEKEWMLFNNIFGDKVKFHDNGHLINERPDAHAKHIDRADLALYRRALTWFEDKMNRT